MKKTKKIKKPNVGIIGIGMVGSALKRYLESKGFRRGVNLFCYDTNKQKGLFDDINKADIIFVCVSTPYHPEKGFILSHLNEAIKNIKGKKIIVIKSTVLPGITDMFQKKYPQHRFLFNPEFLREATSYQDFVNAHRHIIGITKKSKNLATEIINILPKAPSIIMPALEAEIVKYMANSFLALKVVFANEFYDLCKELGADYDKVKKGVASDKRIGSSHLDIFHSGYRGYGGSCFPKDVNAIIDFSESRKINLSLLKKAREINRKLLKNCHKDEKYFLRFLHR